MARKGSHLVVQHLEAAHSRVLEHYKQVLREFLKGRHGIYALYKRTRLYYVGLASNLRSRLRHHLKDRHAGLWDRFSLYITSTHDHLRELEALALRIAAPKGNKSRTKFARSQNLKKYFRRRIAESQRLELDELFSISEEATPPPKAGPRSELQSLVTRKLPIRMDFKGKRYRASIKADGTIRFKGRRFTSPSVAAYKASGSGHAMNGWFLWKYERAPGEWVYLDKLRRRSGR